MTNSMLGALLASAATLGFIHTLVGIDHSLPFIVLGRAKGWSLRKTLLVTVLCGVGHVAASVVIGGIGIGLGLGLTKLSWIDGMRSNLASWLLISFGLAYMAWALSRRRRRQADAHSHAGGVVHAHDHSGHHIHEHATTLTVWSLFVIFVLGPCEPLIPLLVAPALSLGPLPAVIVGTAFAVTTIVTMMAVVTVGYVGLRLAALHRLQPHAHLFAGLAIAITGVLMRVLGI